MKLYRNRLKTLVFSCLIVICTAVPAHAADDLLDMLPGDCLFCVRVNDLSGSLAKIDQYLVGVVPIGTAMMVNMQLASIVGDPMLTGLNMNGNFVVVGLSDMTVGVLVPVTDFDEFVKTNPNCTQTAEGFAVLAAPNSQMGAFALMKAADGKYAIVVPESEKNDLIALKTALSGTAGTLAKKLNGDQSKEATAAPVWGYVNLAALYEQFGPMVTAQMKQAEGDIASQMPGMGELGAFYIKMYMELFQAFAGDADSATLAITPESTDLTLDISLRAKDGSELATMLVADPKAKKAFAYTGYLDNSYPVNALMKWNRPLMTKLYDTMFEAMGKANADAAMNENVVRMQKIVQDWMPLMGDEMAVSFAYAGGQPPFKLQEVVGVTDKAAMEKLMAETMDIADEFYAAMGIPMTFQYQPGVSTYKNATIDKISLEFESSEDPNDMMQNMIEQMYGDSLTYLMAHSADKFYVTMPGSEADIKKLIDLRASAPASGEVKAALDAFNGTPYTDCVVSVNIIKLLQGFGEMTQGMSAMMQGEQKTPMPPFELFSDLNLTSQSSLAIGGYVADGQSRTRLVLPKQHLVEIFNAVMQIQQKVMQQMQMQQPGDQGDM